MPPSDGAGGVSPTWQCVMILWGGKYGVDTVNRLVAAVALHATRQPRFVLLTDRARPGLDARVTPRPIPEVWLEPDMRGGGCQAKLCMFDPGVVPDDLPAVYLDLDTVILGDVGQAVGLLQPGGLMLLQSAVLPFGPLGRLAYRLSGGKRYARGNSSVVVYHPANCGYIAARFQELKRQYPTFGFPPMRADERFMSWAAQAVAAAVPTSFAVKLPTEYMSRIALLGYVWAVLPWVRARRRGLVAVTLCGMTVKPEVLLALPDNGRLTDRHGRTLIWSDTVLGHVKRAIVAFYGPVQPGG
jgi:hypothetical protein